MRLLLLATISAAFSFTTAMSQSISSVPTANSVFVTIAGAPAGGSVGIFSTPTSGSCSAASTSLPLFAGVRNVIKADGSPTEFKLKTALIAGEIICAIIQPAGGGAAVKTAEVTVISTSTDLPTISPVVVGQSDTLTINRGKVAQGANVAFFLPAKGAACTNSQPALALPPGANTNLGNDDPVTLLLAKPLSQGTRVCAILTDPAGVATPTQILTVGPPAAPSFYSINPIRLMGGIDVAASASTDPAAKFLLDGSFEIPLTSGNRTVYSPVWAAADIRLASIAQPGAVSGTSDIATYIKPLTDSTPSQLVQSGEATFATELNLLPCKGCGPSDEAMTLHFLGEGGVVTPLSPDQINPTIYVVNQQLYNYYTGANPPSNAASTAITAACGSTFSTSTPCYVAYVPEGRTRFYRSWDGGLRFRFYNRATNADGTAANSYMFPSAATLTVGQNEYVTGGEMRGFVLHAGGTLLVPAPAASKLAGYLYVYGAVDLNLTGKNQDSQQFLLQTAPSTVTSSSSSVAAVSVSSQNRDRYRFGIALDLTKLISVLGTTKQ